MTANSTKAGKAKGKSLQNLVVDLIRDYFPCLKDDDIRSALSSECGIDIKLSQYARRLFPYAVECKFRDRIDIWQGLAQAEINANKENLRPVLIFKRPRSRVYAVLEIEDFMMLVENQRQPDTREQEMI